MASKPSAMYTRKTFTATRCPLYTLSETSALPPWHLTSEDSVKQSGMCIDFGSKRCRLHALHNLLISCIRSRSDTVLSSRLCGSHQLRENKEAGELSLSIRSMDLSTSGCGSCMG